MSIISDNKKTIDFVLPAAITGYVGYNLFNKKTDTKNLLIAVLVTFAITYLVTSQVTKALTAKALKPNEVIVPEDVPGTSGGNTGGGGGTPTQVFDPKPLTDELKNDIYAIFAFRNKEIYRSLVNLSNSQLVAVYNDWNNRYYSLDNETMIAAMNGESYGIGMPGNDVPANAEAIINRLKTMGCS